MGGRLPPSALTTRLPSSVDKSTGFRPRAQRFDSSRRPRYPKGPLRRPFRRSEGELPARNGHGRAADREALDLVAAPLRLGVERRGPLNLDALRDPDPLAPIDALVPGEVDGERSGRRACRGVLGNAVVRGEHPVLPTVAVACEAVRTVLRRARERAEVRLQGGHLLRRAELDVQVA